MFSFKPIKTLSKTKLGLIAALSLIFILPASAVFAALTFNTTSITSDGALNLTAGAASTFTLPSSSTTALNIQSGLMDFDTTNSRVGIGTTAPAYALDIQGNSALWQSVYPSEDGLIGWWPMNEGSGTKVYDFSPLGNDGTIDNTTNVTWTTGKYGNALQFSNQSSVVVQSGAQGFGVTNNPYGFGANQDFTVSIWAKQNGNVVGYPELIGNNSRSGRSGFEIGVTQDNTPQLTDFALYTTCCSPVISGPTINDGQWHFLLGERSGDNLNFYIDGKLVGTISGAAAIALNAETAGLHIGDDPNEYYVNPFTLSNAKIYNRALSVDEIKTQYLHGISRGSSIATTTSTNAGNYYGSRSIANNTGITTSGTDNTYGSYVSATRTGATGGTLNTYGEYITTSLDNAGAGTHNAYGLYINSVTGADTNYSLYSAGGQSYFAGNVGIGTVTPSYTLSVVGSVSSAGKAIATFTNTNTTDATATDVLRLNVGVADGGTSARFVTFYDACTTESCTGTGAGHINLSAVGSVNYGTTGADFAERFSVPEPTEPGDIIGIAPDQNRKATSGMTLLGVVSARAGFTGNDSDALDRATNPVVGLLGQIDTKVSTENGPIQKGDFLAISSTPGVAMKATHPGQVIGQAMEDYNNTGVGKISAYVHPEFADPEGVLSLNTSGALGAIVTTASSILPPDGALDSLFQASLQSLGLTIQNDILQVKEIVADTITGKTGNFQNLNTQKVHTQQLCVGDTCVTQDQLQQILQQQSSTSASTSAPTTTTQPTPTPDTTTTSSGTTLPSTSTDSSQTSTTNTSATPFSTPTPTPSATPSLPAPTPTPQPTDTSTQTTSATSSEP